MPHFTSPNSRIVGPLPRRDILAVCAFLNHSTSVRRMDEWCAAENLLDRLAAAARMQ